ncbi:hypothetical protein [Undibacterium sp. TS12]|uniref:hypothetical protein n=1 Tax=Undibacterium sp. TS12 TaxID=2908202 RepID=UPI001F4C9F8D|nr:hypothetical protein [Undibacterium sp. TS12]MCH8622954.1 hypothetical protein [Undibacterium sp. TS12]
MDIEEFEKKVQPGAKRSRLEPFQVQIFELKSKRYTNLQIREWLAANGVKVSQEAVRKFISSREGTGQEIAQNPKPKESSDIGLYNPIKKTRQISNNNSASETPGDSETETPLLQNSEQSVSNDGANLDGLSLREKRERRASQFITDTSSNPLLKNLKGK